MRNNKQWIEVTLLHQETEQVPYNFMFSPRIDHVLRDHYSTDDLESCLDFPIRMTGTTSIKPLYADPAKFGETIKDEFGVIWSTNEIDRGSPIVPCLPEPDLTNYTFPRADEPYRFEGLAEWCETNKDHYRVIWVGDLWERATFMRGMEAILMDTAAEPRFVEELLRGIADYILETMRILFDRLRTPLNPPLVRGEDTGAPSPFAGEGWGEGATPLLAKEGLGEVETLSFEGIALSDDYGSQRSMVISPESWRRLVKPVLAEIYSYARANGRSVFHHSCGSFVPIIPDMIDIGLDILHPIQPEAMDILELKREFGGDITFCGGIPTQYLLNDGTPEQVRSEVRRLKQEMGRGGGYILEPGITLQADIPIDNVVAVVEEARARNLYPSLWL